MSISRASRLASLLSKEFDFQLFVYQSESNHPFWWGSHHFVEWFHTLPDNTFWNCIICLASLGAIVLVVTDLMIRWPIQMNIVDIIYNIVYAVYVFGNAFNDYVRRDIIPMSWWRGYPYLIDIVTYLHYPAMFLHQKILNIIKIVCYYLRLHRPLEYLWSLNDYNLQSSVVGTALKFTYIFLVMRVTFAIMWLKVDEVETRQLVLEGRVTYNDTATNTMLRLGMDEASRFFRAVYLVNKMFLPIGALDPPHNDIERIACLVVILCGSLVVTGIAIAALSLVISMHMTPEEVYRARLQLIMKDMKNSNVPTALYEKVVTFYRMYWLNQKGVSETELLPTFPPTLPTTVYTDIYFEAQQKSHILRDLSYQFLREVSKTMETTNFIPGDSIIKRGSNKSSIIYITYGDIEMLTAEDDVTPILRMSRGTILSPSGGCVVAACAPAHVGINAATYCTAHVLNATDLWKVAAKHGRSKGQSFIMNSSFDEHIDKVKKHYAKRPADGMRYKSSILQFKRNIIALKEARDDDGKPLLECNDIFLEVAGCYVMRNRADATLSDESDEICLRSTFPCILQPTSSLQTAWQACMTFLILLVCITHPYHLVYLKNVSLEFRLFDVAVTCIFVLDILMHLSTGANLEEGQPISFTQTSSQQMKSFWFALDLLSTVPMLEFVGEGEFAGLNKLLKLPKAFHMLKEMENVCVYQSNVMRFILYASLIAIASYLVASLQHGVMCIGFGYCEVSNYTHAPYWVKTKMYSKEEDVESEIMFGLYWAISIITFTTHKTAAWGLHSWNNVIYTMVLMEACIVLHIFIEAVYSASIMVTSIMRDEYDSSIENVKNFLIRNNIDPLLRHRFITYLELCWYTDKAYSMTHKQKSILHDLPVHVYQDLVATQRSQYILCIPFVKILHKEYLKELSSKARLFYTSPNEILLNTGDICNEVYVIKQGICELIDPQSKAVVRLLSVKKSFGVLECMLRLPVYYTVRAATHVEVFSISIKHLIRAMRISQIESCIQFAKSQPEYSYLCYRREPFVNYNMPAPSPHRECFKMPRKFERDSAFLDPFNRLGFFSILRYIFPRFTIRPDGKYLFRYEWFRALCALLSSLVFPSYTYLVLQWPWLYYVALLLDLSAYYDICQRTLVAYFNDLGILVYHPASTAANYLNGAFIVDLLACLPLEYIDAARKDYWGTATRVTKTTQYLMLNRVGQLYRVPGAMDILTVYIERRDILLVIKGIPLFMALINVIVCFLVYSSVIVYKTKNSDWILSPRDASNQSWLTIFNYKVFRFDMMETPWNLHLAAYFWVVSETTTTGFNIFGPSNLDVMQVLFLGKIAATMLTTYFAVRVISIRSNVNKLLATFQENMKDIAEYMKKEKLSEHLQREVLEYYKYNWNKMGGTDYRSILKLCDQITLRSDAILHIYGYTFSKCPILFHCYLSLLRILGRAVCNEYFIKDMQIILRDDVIDSLYFVDYGTCDIYDDDTTPEMDSPTCKLRKGSVFGHLDANRTSRSPTTVVASSNVHLLRIKTTTFHEIITEFPSITVLMKKHRPYGENYITSIDDARAIAKSWRERNYSSPLVSVEDKFFFKFVKHNPKLITMYLIIISMACVYCDVYNAGFTNNSVPLLLSLYILDLLFFLKVFIKILLPYFVVDSEAKAHFFTSRIAYLKEEFKYDIVSCLPIELFCLLDSQNRWEKFSLLRLNRMFRVVTIYKCLQKHMERININLVVMTIATVFVWFTLFVHCTTCLWYYIGAWEERNARHSSWFYDSSGKPVCNNFYVCSLYFILTTFTENGIGEILPRKQSEVIFVSVLQIISTMMYMIYVGEFSNIIQFQSFRNFHFYSKYLEIQEYLNNNCVSKNLKQMVKKYCLHLWRETRGLQVPNFLKKAPHCLRLNIMSAAYMHHLTSNPIFKDCEPAFLRQVAGCLQLYIYNEDIYVVQENEITDCLYFIHTGRIQMLTEDTEEKIQVLVAGQYFGVGLHRDIANTHSYKAVSNAQVLTLHINDWEPLLQHFPKSKRLIYGGDSGEDDDEGGKDTSTNAPTSSKLQPYGRSIQQPSSLASDSLLPPPTTPRDHPSRMTMAEKMQRSFTRTRKSTRKSSMSIDIPDYLKVKQPMTNVEQLSSTDIKQLSENSSSVKLTPAESATSQLSISNPSSTSTPLPRGKRPSVVEGSQMSAPPSLSKFTPMDATEQSSASPQFQDSKAPVPAPLLRPKGLVITEGTQMSVTSNLLPKAKRSSLAEGTQMSAPPSKTKLTSIDASTNTAASPEFPEVKLTPLPKLKRPSVTEGTQMSAPPSLSKLTPIDASSQFQHSKALAPTPLIRPKPPVITEGTQMSVPSSLTRLTPMRASTGTANPHFSDSNPLSTSTPVPRSKRPSIAEGTQMSAPPSETKLILGDDSVNPEASPKFPDAISSRKPLPKPKRPSVAEGTQMSPPSRTKLPSVDNSTNPEASPEFPDIKSPSKLTASPKLKRLSVTEGTQILEPPSLSRPTPIGASPQLQDSKAPASTPLIKPKHLTITEGTQMSAPSSPPISTSESPLRPVIKHPAITEGTQMAIEQFTDSTLQPMVTPPPKQKPLKVTEGTVMSSPPSVTSHAPTTVPPQSPELPAPTEPTSSPKSTLTPSLASDQTTLESSTDTNLTLILAPSQSQEFAPGSTKTSLTDINKISKKDSAKDDTEKRVLSPTGSLLNERRSTLNVADGFPIEKKLEETLSSSPIRTSKVDNKHVIFNKPDQLLIQPSTSRRRSMIEHPDGLASQTTKPTILSLEDQSRHRISTSVLEISDKIKTVQDIEKQNIEVSNKNTKKLKTDADKEKINQEMSPRAKESVKKDSEVHDTTQGGVQQAHKVHIQESDAQNLQIVDKHPESDKNVSSLESDIDPTAPEPSSATTKQQKHTKPK